MISVIIPTYNCAAYLPEALESVWRQTRRDFEIVVVDDGSTDDTDRVLQPWRERIVYLRQANAGVAAARNAGVRLSRGEYVAFLDADDLWMPEKLERTVGALERCPEAALACTDFSVIAADGSIASSYFARIPAPRSGMVFDDLLRECFVFTSTVVVRRAALDVAGEFDTTISYADDFKMWLRVAREFPILVVWDGPERVSLTAAGHMPAPPGGVLCCKRERPGNARPMVKTIALWIAALRRLQADTPHLSPQQRAGVRRKIAELQCALGKLLVAERRRGPGRKQFLASLRNHPAQLRPALFLALSYLPPSASQRVIACVKRVRSSYRLKMLSTS